MLKNYSRLSRHFSPAHWAENCACNFFSVKCKTLFFELRHSYAPLRMLTPVGMIPIRNALFKSQAVGTRTLRSVPFSDIILLITFSIWHFGQRFCVEQCLMQFLEILETFANACPVSEHNRLNLWKLLYRKLGAISS